MRPFDMPSNKTTIALAMFLGVFACAPALGQVTGGPITITPVPITPVGGRTDISDNPLSSSTSVQVKPNVLFLLDNSGSMAWAHMPDAVGSHATSVGFRNFECNVIYYNPNIRYTPPKKA